MDLICFKLVAMIPRDQNLVQTMKKNLPKRFFAIDPGRSKKKKKKDTKKKICLNNLHFASLKKSSRKLHCVQGC